MSVAERALPVSATTWWIVAVLGQLIFGAYVLMLYGASAAQGRMERWNAVMPQGWVPGRTIGNLVLASHLLFTVVVVIGGALQLLPQLRRAAPGVHRWNGRLYALSALTLAIGGFAMVWTRGTVGDLSQHIAVSTNALVIVVCAVLAWRHALARRFDAHQRWALRLFLAVSGVWFFRIGLMAWIVVNRGPVGFDPKSFQGPFLTFLGFAQFLLPLVVLELYFHVRANAGAAGRVAMAGLLVVLTLLTVLGIASASMLMWLPRM